MRKGLIPMIAAVALALIAACSDQKSEGPDYSIAPAAPSGFGINGISASCAEFRWDDNSGNETSFILQGANDADFTDGLLETSISSDAVRHRDYSVGAVATRYFRILASNGAGRSAPTAAVPVTLPAETPPSATSRIADHTVIDLIRRGRIPIAAIEAAKDSLHIAYGHTSHGSQIVDGMSGLVAFADAGNCDGTYDYSSEEGLFAWSHDGSGGSLRMAEDMGNYGSAYGAADLNQPGYGAFEEATRSYLDSHTDVNVVMWSWCGGVSGAEADDIADEYLARMNHLETDYPNVAFVYMTGHNDGSGTAGNLHQRNEQIRAYCRANSKLLFDFNDIETYDPDLVSYASRFTDDGCNYDFNGNGGLDFDDHGNLTAGDRNWAVDWQDEHQAGVDWYDCGAAHSQSIVANMKACAVWWLWCRIAGWSGS
jgi:hypothetical protein